MSTRSGQPGQGHFAGKQEIIRALRERHAAAIEGLPGSGATPASPAGQRGGLARAMELAWECRFFARERLALVHTDPQLHARYRQAYERRLDQWLARGQQLVAQGAIRPPQPPATIRDLTIAVWLISACWMWFLEITGDPQDPGQVAKGSGLVLAVLARI